MFFQWWHGGECNNTVCAHVPWVYQGDRKTQGLANTGALKDNGDPGKVFSAPEW